MGLLPTSRPSCSKALPCPWKRSCPIPSLMGLVGVHSSPNPRLNLVTQPLTKPHTTFSWPSWLVSGKGNAPSQATRGKQSSVLRVLIILLRRLFFSLSLWKRKKMKEIQSPELLKPCCDKEGDRGGGGGDTRLKNGWHWLPVLFLQLCNEPC